MMRADGAAVTQGTLPTCGAFDACTPILRSRLTLDARTQFNDAVLRRLFALVTGVLLIVAGVSASSCATAVDPRVIDDAQTVARVRSALVNDPELGTRPVEVRVTAGVAQLTGRVYSEDEARRLVELVRGVGGVVAVRSEVRVEVPPGPEVFPPIEEPDEQFPTGDRRTLALGGSITRTDPRGGELGARVSIGPLIRLGSGRGLGPSIAFNWMTTELYADEAASRSLGAVRLRPVMGGIGYTWAADRTSATLSVVAGYSFNSLRIEDVVAGQRVALRVADSFAWRPGLSMWHDVNGRIAVNVFAGYLMARPEATFLEPDGVVVRALRIDTSVVRVGVAYKIF